MGWSALGDLCINDGKLLGCSSYRNSVGIWVADVSVFSFDFSLFHCIIVSSSRLLSQNYYISPFSPLSHVSFWDISILSLTELVHLNLIKVSAQRSNLVPWEVILWKKWELLGGQLQVSALPLLIVRQKT